MPRLMNTTFETSQGDPFRVNFMILGAQKCGTTSLKDLLVTHPKLVCCHGKEPQYFSLCKDWMNELDSYHRLFPRRSGALYFDASTTYTMFPLHNLEIWNDLYQYNPTLKFLYIVRPPLERIVSAYVHLYERGWTDLPFNQALFQNPSIIWTSRYYQQIIPFVEKFGAQNVKILFLRDLKSKPQEFRRSVAQFLDIECRFSDEEIRSNVATKEKRRHHKYDRPNLGLRVIRKVLPGLFDRLTQQDRKVNRPALTKQQARVVSNILEDDISRFEKLTGRDLSHWRSEHV